MKDFIKAVATEVCSIICRALRLVIVVSLSVVITIIEIMVAMMHYLHAFGTGFTIWAFRKMNGDEYDPEFENSVAWALDRYSLAYDCTIELMRLITDSETIVEDSNEDEEA